MNNRVQIDDDQVHAELAELEAAHQDAPAPASSGFVLVDPAPAPAPPPDWTFAAAGIVGIFDRLVVPNWQLEPDEKNALHASTVQVLAAFFPTALDPRVQACMALTGTMFVIAQARVDPATGKVRPMRVKKPKPEPAAEQSGAAERAAA